MRWTWVCIAWAGAPHRRMNTSASIAAAAASLSYTALAARRSVHVAPSRCHRVEYLLMPKAIDFTSISTRVLPGSREWTKRSGLVVRTLSTTRTAFSGRLSPPCFAVERGRGRGIEGLPLLVPRGSSLGPRITAGAYSWWARRPARTASRYVLSRRSSCRLEGPACLLPGGTGGAEARGPAVQRVAGLALAQWCPAVRQW
jgi:hypothetical protein